jgi:thiol-disulfide isomerase/thioredoxin
MENKDFFGQSELVPSNFSTNIVTCGNINSLGNDRKNYNGGIVLFYASWCPHCVNYKDTYNKIINSVQKTLPGVFCKSYNAGTKEAFWKNKNNSFIDGFPTLVKYKKGANGYVAGDKFMGDREDIRQIAQFIRDLVGPVVTKANVRSKSKSKVRSKSKSKVRSKSKSKVRSKSKRRSK